MKRMVAIGTVAALLLAALFVGAPVMAGEAKPPPDDQMVVMLPDGRLLLVTPQQLDELMAREKFIVALNELMQAEADRRGIPITELARELVKIFSDVLAAIDAQEKEEQQEKREM